MILYHVSTNLSHNGRFYPKLPKFRRNDEDKLTPRVCVSETLEGCFSSMPEGGLLFEETCYDNLFVKHYKGVVGF